jgi:hypothetical protein
MQDPGEWEKGRGGEWENGRLGEWEMGRWGDNGIDNGKRNIKLK